MSQALSDRHDCRHLRHQSSTVGRKASGLLVNELDRVVVESELIN